MPRKTMYLAYCCTSSKLTNLCHRLLLESYCSMHKPDVVAYGLAASMP